jgi:EAL domain-containing protein (putative c-di-GMP-specific phosphodiesterase class I)
LEPGLFLPIVENHSIRVALGEWVINTALDQISEWNAMKLKLPDSVNVGAYQLHDSHFLSNLTAALKAHPDVEPCQLEMEILETSALEDMSQVSELMQSCKDLGVSFTLDDFGTGYSSLTYLKRLPAESLKIDLSFVRDMLTNEDDLAIVQGVISLASVFHRRVIAEGVETAAHGIRLLALGCELAQGYGIARPMKASEVPNWVEAWRTGAAWTA